MCEISNSCTAVIPVIPGCSNGPLYNLSLVLHYNICFVINLHTVLHVHMFTQGHCRKIYELRLKLNSSCDDKYLQ